MTQETIGRAETKPSIDPAFVFSLIGGIIVIVSSVVAVGTISGYPYRMGNMMGGYYGGGNPANLYGIMTNLELLGLAAGIVILISAILMKSRPKDIRSLGIIILAFSLVSLGGTGGFFVGAVFGVIGGILALVNA